MMLPLGAVEARLLQERGTLLQTVVPVDRPKVMPTPETPYEQFVHDYAARLAPGVGLFKLLSNCAFLEPVEDGMAKCGIFGQPERPDVCLQFTAGSEQCRKVRLTRGVWDY